MALSLHRYIGFGRNGDLNSILKQRIKKERERSPVIAIKIGDVLPENVIVEILSWLPVKALLQFKSVCKSWYAIISGRDFISKHLTNYYNHKNDHNDCLLVHYYVSHGECQLYELLIDDPPRVIGAETFYEMPMYGSNICGPCNGIYYLYHFGSYHDESHALWNPAISELKVLPPIMTKPNLSSNRTFAENEVYGFGYDTVTQDYKVVVLKGYCHEENEASAPWGVLIYSLMKDSWRYWGDLTQYYDLEQSECYIVVNGCFYWLQRLSSALIISFNVVTDAIQEIQVPVYDSGDDVDSYYKNNLAVYDDSLAFLVIHEHEKRLDIWTWNGGLWTKKFAIGTTIGIRRPIGHWKKNKLILESPEYGIFLCDPNTQEIWDLAFQMGCWCYGVFVYRESLVSIEDRNKWGHHEEAETDANHF
ncbi:hypothetical protein Cgig2_028516 [Carnegiea gigantea]|uniref:F-box domain-containing protein n=1 Tax=Carnegiea gigantea TaxID=171969 RepID=A0A9Q1JJK5_9CARY|nr:hypothetical protein Cgig2_028516 [Carnegiea gigantea]